MEEINFDFLENVDLQSVEPGVSRLGIIDKQPSGARIRLFNDGKVYPSPELVEKFELQYRAKGNPDQGNGMDIFSTSDWGQWPAGMPANLLIATFVPKSLAKVDLFASTKYDDEGKPKADVLNQGSSVFGKFLIPKLTETYGEDFFADGRLYLDLEVKEDKPLKPVNNGIYELPKPITKGKKAGTMGYERREKIVLFPLVPVVDFKEETATPAEENHQSAEPQADVKSEPVPTPDELQTANSLFSN